MKKQFFLLMVAMMGLMAVSLTSCDDEEIAKTLEGTWKGDMYVMSEWEGKYYEAIYTEITFLKDPYAFSSGTGYWVDYYSDAPWDYVANHIDWRVDLGDIHVKFIEEGTSIQISDYRLDDNRFSGYIYDHGNKVAFYLYNVSRPNYTGYHWGYDNWAYSRGLTPSLILTNKTIKIMKKLVITLLALVAIATTASAQGMSEEQREKTMYNLIVRMRPVGTKYAITTTPVSYNEYWAATGTKAHSAGTSVTKAAKVWDHRTLRLKASS